MTIYTAETQTIIQTDKQMRVFCDGMEYKNVGAFSVDSGWLEYIIAEDGVVIKDENDEWTIKRRYGNITYEEIE